MARAVYASAAGAALDSNLVTGGGTDDTDVLQGVLDQAKSGDPVHLIIDGAALVSGLDVYGCTTVECIAGAGLYLKDGSNRAILRNVHRSRDAIVDGNITIRGGFFHGNKNGQDGGMRSVTSDGETHWFPRNQEPDGSYFAGLQFFGVNDLVIENVTLWNVRAFACHVANASRIDVRNVIVDNGIEPGDHWFNMDGFHFNGPIRYLTIDGMKLRTYDDGLTLAANDGDGGTDDLRLNNEMGPHVAQGPITDVTVNNVQFMDSLRGIRLLSSNERLDRIVINNVTGTVQTQLALISNHNKPSRGNFGSILFNNVAVDGIEPLAPLSVIWGEKTFQKLRESGLLSAELGGAEGSLFVVNGHVEHLNLRNIVTRASDARPVIWAGPNAAIQMLNAGLSIYDPAGQGTSLRQDEGSRIDRLDLRLNGQDEHIRRPQSA